MTQLQLSKLKTKLDKLNTTDSYDLKKLSAKKKSSRGYPDKFDVIYGSVNFHYGEDFVVLYIQNHNEWFKTSPIVKWKKVKKGYEFETKNSHYLLQKI